MTKFTYDTSEAVRRGDVPLLFVTVVEGFDGLFELGIGAERRTRLTCSTDNHRSLTVWESDESRGVRNLT